MTWGDIALVYAGGFASGSVFCMLIMDRILSAPISDDTSSGLPVPEGYSACTTTTYNQCDCPYCNEDQMPQVNDAQLAHFYEEGINQDVPNN